MGVNISQQPQSSTVHTIGMVLLGQGYPRDIRVDKEVDALIRAGHQVHLLTEVNAQSTLAAQTMASGLQVRRIVRKDSVWDKIAGLLWNRYFGLRHEIDAWLDAVKPTVVHIHDLVYAREIQAACRSRQIPTVLDLHENMPAAKWVYGLKHSGMHRLLYRLYNNLRIWRRREHKAAQAATRVLVVVPEALDRFAGRYGMDTRKFSVVSNTESPALMATRFDQPPNPSAQAVNAIYTGFYDPHRGMDVTIKAAGILAAASEHFHLDIVGLRSDEEFEFVQNLVDDAGAHDQISLHRWVPDEQAWHMMLEADIGLVPHNQFEHTETTIPHKLFHFMMGAKPVLVSDCAPLKRVVQETGTGLVFRASDPESMAEAWRTLLHLDAQSLAQMGQAGLDASSGPYSWDEDAKVLVGVYEQLVSGK